MKRKHPVLRSYLALSEKIASKIGRHDTVLLLVYRDGGSAYLTIQP